MKASDNVLVWRVYSERLGGGGGVRYTLRDEVE